jgi:hypothetical protein
VHAERQADDRARFIERPGGADPDAAHVAVDAIENKLDPPRPLGLPLEQHDEVVGELAQSRLDRLDRLHWRGEAPLGAELGRGEARRDRGALEAIQRVEPRHRQGAWTKTRRARQGPARRACPPRSAKPSPTNSAADGRRLRKRAARASAKPIAAAPSAGSAGAISCRASSASPPPRAERARQQEAPRGALKPRPLDLSDGAPQMRHLRPAAERHSVLCPSVQCLF